MGRDIFIDTTSRRICASATSFAPAVRQTFMQGDTEQINLFFLQSTGEAVTPFTYIDTAGQGVRMSIGFRAFNVPEIDGSYSLGFSAVTGGQIAWGSNAAAVANSLNEIASIASAGGVAVTGDAKHGFIVRFNHDGARSGIAADTSRLAPSVVCSTVIRLAGSATSPSVQALTFNQVAAVDQSAWGAVTGTTPHRFASLNFNSNDMTLLLQNNSHITADLEIQLTAGSEITTYVATQCVINKQLIL